ncbi:tetratricopeptide repeat protein [Halomonas halodenitrificans]|uniref:tetratricopeptide repeat protein n=1 Tax=Halomonas halodenitrificans TaxID=28252 RepID=UPI000A720F06|nr:hypothetical protein [Halomonas halodenitrificans]
MQRGKDVDGLLKIWEQKLEQSYFEFPHPEYEDIKTWAVYSVRHGMGNYVFMNDSTSAYPWVFGQCVNFIDIVITKEAIYNASLFNNHTFEASIHKLSEIPSSNLEHKICDFNLWVSQTRPYHFFYDQLKFYFYFHSKKSTSFKNAFFSFGDYEKSVSDDGIFLFPTVIGNNHYKAGTGKKLNEKMEKLVYEDSIKNYMPQKTDDSVLKLWYGITGQKRSWLQQVEGIENIVKGLLPHFNGIELYVDGMTAPEGQVIQNTDDEAVFAQITKRLKGKCTIHSLIGQDYRHKIQICSTVDMFIANAGTGCMVPLRFCKKPGVLHSNTKLFTFPDDYPDTIKRFNKKYVIDVFEEGKKRSDFASYHIPWQHIFNLTVEVLNQTKNTNILSLEVPPVDEVAKAYEAQEQARKKKLMAFAALENRVKPTYKSPDILREVALSFEHSGDIETALKIMQKALELRPTGPLIKKKVIEYQAVIESANQKVK